MCPPSTVSNCDTVNIDLGLDKIPVGQPIIYPNPTNGHLIIKATSKGIWYLTNRLGQLVMSMNIIEGANEIVIPASVANGTYILHNGQVTRQLVIER